MLLGQRWLWLSKGEAGSKGEVKRKGEMESPALRIEGGR